LRKETWDRRIDSDSVPTIHVALNRGINGIDTAALHGLGTF